MTAPTRALAAGRTDRILAAHEVLAKVAAEHRLYFTTAEVAAGASRTVQGGFEWLGEPTIDLTCDPADFPGWCRALKVAQPSLHRRPADILARFGGAQHLGLRWAVTATIPRALPVRATADLPGDTLIPWRDGRARIGLARLEAALTVRGLA